MKNILIVEREEVVLSALKFLIQNELDDVTVLNVRNIDEGMEILEKSSVDVFLWSSPQSEELPFLLKNTSSASVILFYSDFRVVIGMKRQVKGFISRNASTSEFLLCIKAALNHETYYCSSTLYAALNYITENNYFSRKSERTSNANGSWSLLSRREKQVHALMIQGSGTTVIANTLKLKPSTISTIKSKVFRKMNANNLAELISRSKA